MTPGALFLYTESGLTSVLYTEHPSQVLSPVSKEADLEAEVYVPTLYGGMRC